MRSLSQVLPQLADKLAQRPQSQQVVAYLQEASGRKETDMPSSQTAAHVCSQKAVFEATANAG